MNDQLSLLDPFLATDVTRVHDALRHHRGREKAIKAPDLAGIVNLGTRKLQSVIHELIHDHAIPVGSAMSEPYGYFLAITDAEREDVADMFHRRGLAFLATERKLRQISTTEQMRRLQIEMEVA